MTKTNAYRSIAVGVAVATTFALAGCSSSEGTPSGEAESQALSIEIEGVGTIETDPELQALVPQEILDAGSVTVATNAPFAPYEMFESETSETLIGLEPDLGHAVGALLGVEFEFQQQPFDGLIPGVQAGKYDVVMATFFDTAEREAVVDMVNYSASGSGLLVATGNPEGYETSADLCGASVAVQPGSAQVDIVAGFSEECVAAGEADLAGVAQHFLHLIPDYVDALGEEVGLGAHDFLRLVDAERDEEEAWLVVVDALFIDNGQLPCRKVEPAVQLVEHHRAGCAGAQDQQLFHTRYLLKRRPICRETVTGQNS